jgi:hypothetical protein
MSKDCLLEKYQLFLSNLEFFAETNILNLQNEALCRLKEMCDVTRNLIDRTGESDDYNQLWSVDFEDTYEHLVQEYFEMINTLSLTK